MKPKQLRLLVQTGRSYDYRVDRDRDIARTIALLKEEHLIDDELLHRLRDLRSSNAEVLAATSEYLLDQLRSLSYQIRWHPSEWRDAIADTHYPGCGCSFCRHSQRRR